MKNVQSRIASESLKIEYVPLSSLHHPAKNPRLDTDASNKYRQYSSKVWSTRWKGNIVLTIENSGEAYIDAEYTEQSITPTYQQNAQTLR